MKSPCDRTRTRPEVDHFLLRPVGRIDVLDVLREVQEELLELLDGLNAADWERATWSPAWTVKDVAAHLLDGDLRRLSLARDRQPPPQPERPIAGDEDLVAYLDQLNADWIVAAARLSPGVLCGLLGWSVPRVLDYFATLDPHGPAVFPVSWAGEGSSASWFDVAREYTEKWLHQQQIREAVGRPLLLERRFLHPVLDTFTRALPHACRELEAEPGTALVCELTGPAGDAWTLHRLEGSWELLRGAASDPASRVVCAAEKAWRLFATRRRKTQLSGELVVEGDPRFGRAVFEAVAVMA